MAPAPNRSMAFALAHVLLSLLEPAQAATIEIYKPKSNCTSTSLHTSPNISGTCNFTSYVALGDSWAAGINAQPDGELSTCADSPYGSQSDGCTFDECARNSGAYPWQFSQKHARDTNTQFMACSGADTASCDALQILPTMQALTSDDLVSITIGGNNGDAFVSMYRDCVYLPTESSCDSALAAAQGTIDNIAPSLDELFNHISNDTTGPQVVVMGYASFWPSGLQDASQCQSFFLEEPTGAQKETMNSLVTTLNGALATAARGHGFTFVDVDAGFEGHRLCDVGDTWFQWNPLEAYSVEEGMNPRNAALPISVRGLFKPTAEGQMVYTQALEQALGCI